VNLMLLAKVASAVAIALFAVFAGPRLVEDAWRCLAVAVGGVAALYGRAKASAEA
jgi:hypothetical protein